MIGRRLSLVGLVEEARDRALGDDDLRYYLRESQITDLVAEEVCRVCLGGQFRWACKVLSADVPYQVCIPEEWWPNLVYLASGPAWEAFAEVVTLAERIDCFLGTLERGGPLAPLARDCREDLDLLLVLADCCQDSGLPHTAGDARHLHSLIESHLRGSPSDVCTPPSGPEEDYDSDLE